MLFFRFYLCFYHIDIVFFAIHSAFPHKNNTIAMGITKDAMILCERCTGIYFSSKWRKNGILSWLYGICPAKFENHFCFFTLYSDLYIVGLIYHLFWMIRFKNEYIYKLWGYYISFVNFTTAFCCRYRLERWISAMFSFVKLWTSSI